MLILGFLLLSLFTMTFVFGFKVFSKPKVEHARNHAITGSVSNALRGEINVAKAESPEDVAKGFTVDIRNGELVACSQLSREAIKSN